MKTNSCAGQMQVGKSLPHIHTQHSELVMCSWITYPNDSAGTRKVECMDPHRQLRRNIVEGIQYPFGLVSFGRNLYYTDWRRYQLRH